MQIKHFHLDANRLESFVGPLESRLLSVLWKEQRELTAMDVWHINAKLPNAPQLAYSTVVTTLNRLATKQIIIRDYPTRGKSLYRMAYNESEFIDRCLRAVFEHVRKQYPQTFAELIDGYASTVVL